MVDNDRLIILLLFCITWGLLIMLRYKLIKIIYLMENK